MKSASRDRPGPGRLAIIGPYPPPSGGVSTHVERLCHLLDRRGIDYRLYNLGSDSERAGAVVSVFRRRRRFLLAYAAFGREPAVYVVSPRLSSWVFAALLAAGRGKRVAVRIQNARLIDWQRAHPFRSRIAGAALRRVSAVVCVSRGIADAVARLGVESERIAWLPGFLPPAPPAIGADAPTPAAAAFLAGKHPVIAANGKVAFFRGQDLYGLDMLVELAARLRPDHPRLGIIACLYDIGSDAEPYLDALRAKARALGAADRTLFHTQPGPFVPVLAGADLFVRPTNTDGDASSLREAIFLGVPAVASDAAERPAGAALFRNRDVDDLVDAVRRALVAGARDPARRTKATSAPAASSADQERIEAYLELLADLAGGAR